MRLQFVSGTHAIAAALFGVLRPGDRLLSITGRPYDTLEEVIGLRGKGQGSLAEFGVAYDEIDLQPDGAVDEAALNQALEQPCRMVLIQRSCGYSGRPSVTVEQIAGLCVCASMPASPTALSLSTTVTASWCRSRNRRRLGRI